VLLTRNDPSEEIPTLQKRKGEEKKKKTTSKRSKGLTVCYPS
jgi:hypothetical protein